MGPFLTFAFYSVSGEQVRFLELDLSYRQDENTKRY